MFDFSKKGSQYVGTFVGSRHRHPLYSIEIHENDHLSWLVAQCQYFLPAYFTDGRFSTARRLYRLS
jgi:hypothetical protein